MKDISIKAASPKEVFERAFESKIFTCEHSKDKVKTHSKNACRICEDIALQLEKNGIKVRKKLLKKAAYLHDIGKAYRKGDAHPFMSVICMYDIFDCSGEERKEYAWKLGQIIIAHKGIFCPPVCVAKEAAILRMADKIDRFGRKDDASKKYKRNLKKIKSYFECYDAAFFENLKKACDTAKEKYS